MADYHSGSNLRQHSVKNLLLPSKLTALLYFLISLILLTLLNLPAFGQLFTLGPITAGDLGPLTEEFSAFQDKLSTPLVMLFWLIIGAAVYTTIWLSENVFFIAKSEVDASRFVTTNSSIKRAYLQSALASNLFLILMVLVWASFIALYLRLLLPVFSDLFHDSLFSAPVYERLAALFAAVLGNTLCVYFILLMRRVITYSWRANRP